MMNSKQVLFSILTTLFSASVPLMVTAQIPTPTHVWTGAGSTTDYWDNPDNWVGNAPASSGSSTTVLGFGAADSYYSENIEPDFRVRNLIFLEDAEAYTLAGASINVHGAGTPTATQNIIYNLSGYQQTIENNLYFTVNNTTFDTGAAGILWTGDAETSTGTGAFTLNKRGSGELILRGNLIPADQGQPETDYNKLTWNVEKGTLVMDASAAGFAVDDSNNVTLAGGNLKVIGGDTGATTVNLGTFSFTGNESRRAQQITVDSNGGAGTTLNFTDWTTIHHDSPGFVYSARHVVLLNFDLSSPGSAVSMGTIRHFVNSNWRTPLANGLINRATVTDGVKTGFATVVGGDEFHNGGTIARYEDWTTLPVSGANNTTNYRVDGSLQLTTNASVYTLTIGGAGTLSSASASGNFTPTGGVLMEEGVGDYTITVPSFGHSSGSQSRIYNYSTVGVLTITGHVGSTSGNYGNARFVSAGPGTVRLTGDGKIGENIGYGVIGEFVVSQGRLELDGLGGMTIPVLEVLDGTLAGQGQIGGGVKWVWVSGSGMQDQGTRYSEVIIYDGGTLDASNVGKDIENNDVAQKSLTIHGSVTLNADSTYHMRLAETRGAALSVTRDPSLDPEVASVFLTGDLSLDLDYAPNYNEWIILLTTDGVIDGQFLTINGGAFGGDEGDLLSLEHNSQWYDFQIVYDHDLGAGITAVALHAIPEPSTVALLAGLVLAGIVWVRRQRIL